MQYALLIYVQENLWDSSSEQEQEALLEEHRGLQRDARARGEFGAAVRLMPSEAATTVRSQGAERAILDGPFMETKELLAGFYLVDCAGLDEALAYARRLPTYGSGAIEVRPVQWAGFGPLAASEA